MYVKRESFKYFERTGRGLRTGLLLLLLCEGEIEGFRGGFAP